MEKKRELTLRKIFRYLMEKGFYPTYEKTHILFASKGNAAVLEYEEDVLSIRLFFSIEKEQYDNFLEASNACMQRAFMVRPVILEDMKTIMFSCESICDTYKDFCRFFPRMLERLDEGLYIHKQEMKQVLITEEVVKAALPVTEEGFSVTGSTAKLLS